MFAKQNGTQLCKTIFDTASHSYSAKNSQKINRCRSQQCAVCPQHFGVDALAGRASSVQFSVSLKFHRAIMYARVGVSIKGRKSDRSLHINKPVLEEIFTQHRQAIISRQKTKEFQDIG